MEKITPFLLFDGDAEKAAKFYVSVFKNGKIESISRYTEAGPAPEGTVMIVSFRILGQRFIALNAGFASPFTEAVSFMVNCGTQREVDYYWRRLTSGGGSEMQCGWLKDKFGVRWQITPRVLMELASGKDRAKAARVMRAMMKMTKIDIKGLRQAARKTSKTTTSKTP